ncbi:hypothetical protein QYE76_044371 [Lolium multiflorum]|uniref:Integrase catalytic domain-containing protein n=1 Tax=Lolium multiflorum TaxID=4521 RepID=A0AAD8WZ22_LOLMU|nr:hypothetical protein QYE76_044371 [Lolium multiflorum]
MPPWFIPAYFKKTQASKLGDAQGIPFFIDNIISKTKLGDADTNPSKEIFSELDEINARVLFLHEASKTEGKGSGATSAATLGGAAAWARALVCGALVWPPALPFRLLKVFVAKPLYREPRYENLPDAAAAASGDSEIAPAPPERGIISRRTLHRHDRLRSDEGSDDNKKELAKFTTTKSKMGLDDLLSKQRSNNQKYGLGYDPKPYKKNNYKKEKPAQEKNKKGYSSGGPKWVFDSGCTNHMTGGRGVLDQFIEDINKKSSITFGDNSKGKVLGYGKVAISKDLCLETVMLVEHLGYNLLSIYHLADAGYNSYFTKYYVQVFRSDNLKLVLVGYVENNLYVVDLSKESPSPSTCLMAAKHDEGWLWHRRLGHVNMRNLKQLLKGEHIVGLTGISFEKDRVCSACVAGKQLKKKHPIKSIVTTSRPLELLHLDLFGPSHYDTLGGSKYSWVFLLKSKDETHREFITFAKKAQRTYESEIKAIRTDNGTEFKNYTMQEFVDDEGIKHEFSAPYTPQQNGVVERKNRTIIEMARTMLSEFNSPHNFWGEAISTAVHYSNRLFLRPLHNKTPYELLTGNKPNVMYIRVFGCKCLVKNNKGKLGKFETRTIEGIFVGYAENSHAYRYYNRSTGTIEVSCDVVFLEDNGSQVEQVVPCVAGNDDDPSSAIKHMGIGHIRPMEVHSDDQGDGIEVSSSPQVEPSSTQVEPSSATQDVSSTQDEPHPEEQEESPQPTEQDHDDDQETSSTHVQAQVVPHDQVLARDEFIDHEGTIRKIKAATRASDMKVDQVLGSISKGVVTRRHHALLITYCQHHAFVSSFEPLKVHEALVDPDWVIAMQEELECFTRNEVWSLVERPKDHRINVIGTKWVFKNKQDENGIVIRNKARNPSKDIFSELDEINAQGPIFARSFQKREEGRKWGHEAPPQQGGAAQALAAPVCGALVWPRLPFAYLKPPSRNPQYREPHGKPSRDAAANPISGDSGDRLRHRGFISRRTLHRHGRLRSDESNVDPNNVPLASLVAQEENVDVNFIKNNNFNNNAYRNNSGNNYRPYPSANGNDYGNSYGNSYNNNRSVPPGLEAMLKEFISTQTAFNKSVEEKLDKIDIIASRVDRLASDVDLLKLKVMPNNDIDNKITTTSNAIQVRINENIRLMAELRARWDREENEKLAKENNVAKVWTITTISNDNDSHVAAPPTINGKIIGVGNVSTPSAKRTKLPEIAKTAETACDKTAEIFSNLGDNDPIAVAHNDLDFDYCHISEVIKFLQKLAKSPNASAINLAFTKHITNALIKAREEKLKLETSIPRKLEDGWEPIIKMKFNDFECNALCDLGASISMPKKIYDMLDLPPLKNCYLDVNLADNVKKKPLGMIDNVRITVNNNLVPVDFVVLDIECNASCPIVLGRPFLRTVGVVIDMREDTRTVNPYRYEQRTYTGGDKFFWTKTQAALWVGYYDNTHECMKNGAVVKPKAINPEELALHEATKYRFVVQTLKVMDRMTPNYAQYVQRLINHIVPAPLNTRDERVIMAPFKFPAPEGRPEVPSMMPANERRSKEHHDPAASSSYSRRPKHGAARFFSSMWQMCKNTNDVAHQSLALNQETRRRQNEFMATRNVPVPPPGPELAPVVAPQWEMPPLTDEMIQNFDFSMYAHGGLPPRTARTPTPPADDGDGDEDEDDALRVMMTRAPTPPGMSSIDGCDSISPLFFAFLVFRCQRGRRE